MDAILVKGTSYEDRTWEAALPRLEVETMRLYSISICHYHQA
jgi:hypothetical protein